ncbi:MAG: TIGR03560 family F420-dependent LLM class oxidoreductase [Candidatus Dormiibacterota bacterium]
MHLPSPCVVVLAGPGASGKSSWAAEHFPPDTIVASDRLRALVGAGQDDFAASSDAFSLLDQVIRARLRRRLTTVIDTLGLDPDLRAHWRELSATHGLPCVVVAFDTAAAECRARNRNRQRRIPAQVLDDQLRAWRRTRGRLAEEGFDAVLTPRPVRVVPEAFVASQAASRRQQEQPSGLRFGLHLSSFTFPGGRERTAERLRDIAAGAEAAGFDAIYVMDHFRQIPQVGRAWDDFLESYTTLAYLAAATERVGLGCLVTGITYRNLGHLGKLIATLDVLSGGRAICGLGAAWFRQEHDAFGWRFPPLAERLLLLEDALQLLPRLWGPGGAAFDGRVVQVPDSASYPRPLQERVPILVGGGGERRTLRLAARYADAANVMGDLPTVQHKGEVLRRHCQDVGRDPREVALTHLSTTLVAADDRALETLLDHLRPPRQDRSRFAAAVNAGTVEDQIGRFRELADAGVGEVMLRVPGLASSGDLEPVAKVIAAFR